MIADLYPSDIGDMYRDVAARLARILPKLNDLEKEEDIQLARILTKPDIFAGDKALRASELLIIDDFKTR